MKVTKEEMKLILCTDNITVCTTPREAKFFELLFWIQEKYTITAFLHISQKNAVKCLSLQIASCNKSRWEGGWGRQQRKLQSIFEELLKKHN